MNLIPQRLKDFIIKAVAPAGLVPLGYRDSWWHPIHVHEPYTGAWQRNDELRVDTALSYHAVFACVSLIAGDIGKLRIKLVEQGPDDIWRVTVSPAFDPVLRKPNGYQNRIRFIECWIASKLLHGNAYIFTERDQRNVVVEMHVLDPTRVKPLVSPAGEIYYQLASDNLARLNLDTSSTLIVPATEIIHDRMNCYFHPLVGLSPLYAGALSVSGGMNIQRNATTFFANASRPSGILSAPGHISNDVSERIKAQWTELSTGRNVGRLIVAGDDIKFQPLSLTAEDAQLIEQAKFNAETICSLFHVPSWMVGIGEAPTYNNIEALSTAYYTQCLQTLIESLELCLDEGLGLDQVPTRVLGTELDLDGLLRMDTPTMYDAINKAIGGGWLSPNEGRARANYGPAEGGNSPMMQQQQFSLAALAKRDNSNPFPASAQPAAPAVPPDADEEEDDLDADATAQLAAWELRRALAA